MARRHTSGQRRLVRPRVPDRGDILHIDLEPTRGKEQQGMRYALVLSAAAFNQLTGLVLACPITQGGGFARTHGFAVPLTGTGTTTQGVVLCHQVRVLSYAERNARVIETAPTSVVDDVIARVQTLLD
jgi:mRNA interferase ChpB